MFVRGQGLTANPADDEFFVPGGFIRITFGMNLMQQFLDQRNSDFVRSSSTDERVSSLERPFEQLRALFTTHTGKVHARQDQMARTLLGGDLADMEALSENPKLGVVAIHRAAFQTRVTINPRPWLQPTEG